MGWNLYDYLNQQSPQILSALGGFFKSSGRPAYQMSGPGLQQLSQNRQYYGPAYASAEALGIKSGGPRNYGPGYKEKELAAGAAAERFRPGAGFPGQQAAADRAYESEKSRVAQITAQDPELQRYEAARKIAAAPGATPEQIQSAEDIGMQMWAKANPQLAAKVRPGQSGYDAIQGSLAGQAASQGYGYQMPRQMLMTPPPGVNAPQGLPAISSFGPTSTYGEQGLQIDPEMQKKFQALLNQSQK